jgi:hypothetical protein
MRCLLMAREILFHAVDLVEEELAGLRFGLQHVEANVARLLAALAGVLKGGLKEWFDFSEMTRTVTHTTYMEATLLRSAISKQRPA